MIQMIQTIKDATDDNIGRQMALDKMVEVIKQDPDHNTTVPTIEYAHALQMIISQNEKLIKTISGYHFGLQTALDLINDGQMNSGWEMLRSVQEDPSRHAVELSDGLTACCDDCEEGLPCCGEDNENKIEFSES